MTPEQQDEALAMYAKDVSMAAVARNLGVSYHKLRQHLERAGVKRHSKRRDPMHLGETTTRACLTCRRPFESWGRGNRRCLRCKSEDSSVDTDFYRVALRTPSS